MSHHTRNLGILLVAFALLAPAGAVLAGGQTEEVGAAPAYHPPVLWQRMHKSPAPSKSCSAIASVAQKIGSRPALPIALPRQPKAGSLE